MIIKNLLYLIVNTNLKIALVEMVILIKYVLRATLDLFVKPAIYMVNLGVLVMDKKILVVQNVMTFNLI